MFINRYTSFPATTSMMWSMLISSPLWSVSLTAPSYIRTMRSQRFTISWSSEEKTMMLFPWFANSLIILWISNNIEKYSTYSTKFCHIVPYSTKVWHIVPYSTKFFLYSTYSTYSTQWPPCIYYTKYSAHSAQQHVVIVGSNKCCLHMPRRLMRR